LPMLVGDCFGRRLGVPLISFSVGKIISCRGAP
jgi:hypothetical protein